MSTIAAVGQGISLRNVKANQFQMQAGQTMLVPAGNYFAVPGPYTFVQILDPITGIWRNISQTPNSPQYVESDGVNYRFANLTGCVVGALTTSGGSGFSASSVPTITASTGSAKFQAIVGGQISSPTFTSVGTNYTQPPNILVSPPPPGGVPCQAHVTISGSTGSTVVIDDPGAGYTSAPTFTVVNDVRDTTGTNMTISATVSGSTVVSEVLVTDHGVPITSVPTLSSSGGAGSGWTGLAIMCFAVTGYTVATAGTGYNGLKALAISCGSSVAGSSGSAAFTSPTLQQGIFIPRGAQIQVAIAASAITATGAFVVDGGLHQAVPGLAVISNGAPGTVGLITATVGGITDTCMLLPC
jgi:hypothetical protein